MAALFLCSHTFQQTWQCAPKVQCEYKNQDSCINLYCVIMKNISLYLFSHMSVTVMLLKELQILRWDAHVEIFIKRQRMCLRLPCVHAPVWMHSCGYISVCMCVPTCLLVYLEASLRGGGAIITANKKNNKQTIIVLALTLLYHTPP